MALDIDVPKKWCEWAKKTVRPKITFESVPTCTTSVIDMKYIDPKWIYHIDGKTGRITGKTRIRR